MMHLNNIYKSNQKITFMEVVQSRRGIERHFEITLDDNELRAITGGERECLTGVDEKAPDGLGFQLFHSPNRGLPESFDYMPHGLPTYGAEIGLDVTVQPKEITFEEM